MISCSDAKVVCSSWSFPKLILQCIYFKLGSGLYVYFFKNCKVHSSFRLVVVILGTLDSMHHVGH